MSLTRKKNNKGLAPYQKSKQASGKSYGVFGEVKIFQKSSNRFFGAGFTLIEIMIAIFLIGVALIGVLSFFNSSLTSSFDAKNELIAAGLAQEGAELVRNLADYKKLNGAAWSDLTNASTGLPSCSRIDYQSLTSPSHACQTGDYVCLSGDGRYFQCSGDTGIGMTRTISYSYDPSEKSLKIISQVKWNDRTTNATDILYENNY